jgi:hypothetical protein
MHAILRIGPYICGEWNYGCKPLSFHHHVVHVS